MARSSYLFTSESVSEGHPDKVADRISDTVVDAFLGADPYARVACETMVTTQRIIIAGEVRGPGEVIAGLETKIRAAVKDIGYEQNGFHWATAHYECHLHAQSADIAMGVDAAGNKDEGAGDQGIMFGYATNETPELMPATLQYSHNILKVLAEARHSGKEKGLEPDAKSQVTLLYENGKPVRATSIVLSTQHKAGLTPADIADMAKPYILKVLPEGFVTAETEWHINPTGNFVIGGPDGDCGLTGRKIIVDTYGGAAPHGGGAFSGKDDQGRPLGRLYQPLPRQERRRRRSFRQVHHPDRLRDRRLQAAQLLCRPARHRKGRPGEAGEDPARTRRRRFSPGDPRAPQPQPADLCPHRRLRPFRPRGRGRWRLLVGEDRSRRRAERRVLIRP